MTEVIPIPACQPVLGRYPKKIATVLGNSGTGGDLRIGVVREQRIREPGPSSRIRAGSCRDDCGKDASQYQQNAWRGVRKEPCQPTQRSRRAHEYAPKHVS